MSIKYLNLLLFCTYYFLISCGLGFLVWLFGFQNNTGAVLLASGIFIGGFISFIGYYRQTAQTDSRLAFKPSNIQKQQINFIHDSQNSSNHSLTELFHTIFGQIPVGFLLLDDRQRIIFINVTAANLLNNPNTNQFIGQDITGFLRHSSLLAILQEIRDTKQKVFEAAFSLAIPETRYWHISLERIPVFFNNNFVTIVTLRDQTALKIVAQESQDFIANASHQLQTPLAVIRNIGETLQTHFSNNTQHQDFLSLLMQQTERMSQLVSSLLLLAKVDQGTGTATYKAVSLRSLIDNLIKGLAPLINKTTVKLHIARNMPFFSFIPSNLIWLDDLEKLPDLWGDEQQLYVVFENLLENAIRYSKSGKNIWIGFTLSPNQQLNKNSTLTVAFIDEGVGIQPNDLPRLGERFYRCQNEHNPTGTGLGLAIVQKILYRHHGQLLIYSKPEQGSCFLVSLPAVESDTTIQEFKVG